MSELVVNGVRLSLTGPETLPLSVVLRGSPAFNPERAFFTISMKNESGGGKRLPFDELRRSVTRIYRNPSSGREIVDNRTPPPRRDGAVETFTPGETRTFQDVFDYPETIATMTEGVALLQFCVKWEASWLRVATYAPGAYDWNESYELCRDIRIVDDTKR